MGGFGFALLTAFIWGIAPIFAKLGLQEGGPNLSGPQAVIIRFTGATLCFLLMMAFMAKPTQWGGILTLPPRAVGFLFIEGICGALLGHFTYYAAMKVWDASRVVGVTSSYAIVTLVLSLLFLNESFSLLKGAGIALVVAGVLLIKFA